MRIGMMCAGFLTAGTWFSFPSRPDSEFETHSKNCWRLKLIGFAIWERRGGYSLDVTVPARQYAVNGERRSFALLRPITDASAQVSLRDLILAIYVEYT
jgi:hypothetical protein